MVEFRVLGEVEAVFQGQPLALNGRRSREVLALLLLHAGTTVPRTRLIDGVWGDDAPPTVDASLRVAISKLRKALAEVGARELLVTRPAGYVLRIEQGSVDARRFEDLAAQGHRALGDARAEEAARLLADALGLWRGTPYTDIADGPDASVEVRRLEAIRLAAQDDLVDAQLALGRHCELIAELERLVEQHPTRERRTGQLMLSLYRSGRQADALEAYRRAAARLREEHGLVPGPELRALEQAILRHDPALRLREPDTARPRAVPARHRRTPLVIGSAVAVLTAIGLGWLART